MASLGRTANPAGGARINSGFGRLLIGVYGLFALSASARAGVQIATKFAVAPVAYLLSALAAVIYLLATVFLARSSRRSRQLAIACCSTELVGVLVVGTASLVNRHAFPDATVWSGYGWGYGFVPLALPIVGLVWLARTRAPNPIDNGLSRSPAGEPVDKSVDTSTEQAG